MSGYADVFLATAGGIAVLMVGTWLVSVAMRKVVTSR